MKPMTEKELLQHALELPLDARRRLVEQLKESCAESDASLKDLIVEVAMTRSKAVKEGRMKTVDAFESLARAKAKWLG